MKKLSPLILIFILCSVSYGQAFNPKIQFSNSFGIGIKESKPVFTAGLSFEAVDNFQLGIKAGIYSYEETLSQVVFNDINYSYAYLKPGVYAEEFFGSWLDVTKPTYIAAITGAYNISVRFSFNASLGIKYYQSCVYDYVRVEFSKPSMNHSLTKSDITIYTNDVRLLKRDVLRPYISAGLNYRIKSFSAGIYADNIISIGLNFGKDF